ncbi:MAG: histidinol dehydrogenase [Synergistaceae bacterium]|jgi:histidinol dehydrogenase|nr:histidinol dehydrogenase [Synergistaceae bacterium]
MKYLKTALTHSADAAKDLREAVAGIIDDVRKNSDGALLRCNLNFDGCSRSELRVSKEEIAEAYRVVPEEAVADIRAAAANIRAFTRAQRGTITDLASFSPEPGVTLGHRIIPVEACCCYVPGGSYPLYSTALMLAIPAKVAGVKRIAACSPPMKGTSKIHPMTLLAMDTAGTDEIYAVGGAQAVAAFAYGTGQIASVDLIVGPGNRYVTEAKRQCYGQVGIDFVAGPSEVMVIADDTANADIIAADMLAQCEHDRLAQSVVVTTSEKVGRDVIKEVDAMLGKLATASIAGDSWHDYGEVSVVDSIAEAIDIANRRAPEHLEVHTADPESVSAGLFNYGSLFVGKYTAEVFGDYASGTNHTLPTSAAARYTGGVWVGTFLKTCTHQSFTKEAMLEIAPLVKRMAEGEGLSAHAAAAEARRKKWG